MYYADLGLYRVVGIFYWKIMSLLLSNTAIIRHYPLGVTILGIAAVMECVCRY